RVGGTPELVRDGETGLLFASDDEDGLVKALTIVLNSPTLAREWGAKARRVARADFTIERAREQFEQLYHTLLREKGLRKNSGELASDRSRSEKRLRVAIVAPSLRNIGGQSIQAALLTRCWQDDKRVAIYTINIDPVFPQWLG